MTSLLAVVVVIAFFAGIAYGLVAIPAQTQLQEDLPEDVRGRVFGVLNMLVSVASFLPIIIVGPIADLVGTTLGHLRRGDRRRWSPGSCRSRPRQPQAGRARVRGTTVGARDPIAAALRAAEVPTPDRGRRLRPRTLIRTPDPADAEPRSRTRGADARRAPEPTPRRRPRATGA